MENKLHQWPYRSALLMVAHPDDEILWAGGTVLMHPETDWTVLSLCRRNDPDRAPKFRKVLAAIGAAGAMGDLDDGPEQRPIAAAEVQEAVLSMVGDRDHDLIITHSVDGEYTRHRRHEEVGAAVLALWDAGKLRSQALWAFAYQDAGTGRLVRAIRESDIFEVLPQAIWERKRGLIIDVYGFAPDSFETHAALQEEAFWRMRPDLTKETTV